MENKELLFSEYLNSKIKNEFINKIIDICKKLGIEPNWLMFVIYKESRFNPHAVNKETKATGLIQFMPNTAIYLGTTVDNIYNMNEIEQLDYVYKYLKTYKTKLTDAFSVYSAIFFPRMLYKDDDYVLDLKEVNISPEQISKQNKTFDLNNDNKITKKEFREWFNKEYKKIENKFDNNNDKNNDKKNLKIVLLVTSSITLILAGLGIVFFSNNKNK